LDTVEILLGPSCRLVEPDARNRRLPLEANELSALQTGSFSGEIGWTEKVFPTNLLFEGGGR
jgi:hypothetical protein